MQETFDESKKQNVFHERVFFSNKVEDVFAENKNEIKTNIRSLCSQKMLGLNGREWKKKKKRKILLGIFFEEEW